MGHTEAGLSALRRAVALDPLNAVSHSDLIEGLRLARRYDESLAAYRVALSQVPDTADMQWSSGLVYYALGDIQRERSLCEGKAKEGNAEEPWAGCLAIVYWKLGRSADAEAWMEKTRRDGATPLRQATLRAMDSREMPPKRSSGWKKRSVCVT